MQLGKHQKLKLRRGLASATCTLLGTAISASHAADNWDVSTSAFLYAEEDERVMDISAKTILIRELDEDNTITINAQIDTLSGASPNGAVPVNAVQTFTRPSGDGKYKVNANETPLDDTFQDTRIALSGNWKRQLNRFLSGNGGLSVSNEFDYLHLGLNGSLAKEINDKNTTLSGGIALSFDKYSPLDGAPTKFSEMLFPEKGDSDDDENENSVSTDKVITDVILGVSQVLSRRAIAQFNYSFSFADGYLNDPYKLLSVVNESSGELLPSSDGKGGRYVYENRPNSRTSHNMFAKVKYHLENDIVDISYRYHTDDWDIISHTVDFRYRFILNNDKYLEPHVRYYKQSKAKFHRYFLTDSEAGSMEYASADYRLAAFNATTLGLKFGIKLKDDKELSTRIEYYQASGDDHPNEAIGVLANQDLYPEVSAWILQASYSFKF